MTATIELRRADTGKILAAEVQPPPRGWTPTPPPRRTDDPTIRAIFDPLFERLDELKAWIDGETAVAQAEMSLLCDRDGIPQVFAELPPNPTVQLQPDRLDAEARQRQQVLAGVYEWRHRPNSEDCPRCDEEANQGRDLPYPWICPGHDEQAVEPEPPWWRRVAEWAREVVTH